MPKAARAPRTAPTPADRMQNLRTAILRAKLVLPHDAPEQFYLSAALGSIESSLKARQPGYVGAHSFELNTPEIAGAAV